MARLVEAVKCAEIISEKFNIPLADLVDVFAEIPTSNNEDCTPQTMRIAHQKKEVGRSENTEL